jgi:hypothetical protein
MNHPVEGALALLAGGEISPVRRFFLDRHVRSCPECQETLARFHDLRSQLSDFEPPDLNWGQLEAEMRANIHLGFEAGQCVRVAGISRRWSPRLAIALASLVLLVSASFLMRNSARPVHPQGGASFTIGALDKRFTTRQSAAVPVPVLQTTAAGIELSSGATSLTLLSRQGAIAHQTVSAQGEIGARYVDGETGSVTINNVYLQ